MGEFVMPMLGADMEAGVLVEWRKQPGDYVARGEIIAEVETDKGLIEIEVFTSGVLERTLVAPGAKVPVGTVLAIIREDGGAASPAPPVAAPAAAPPPSTAPGAAAELPRPAMSAAPAPARVRASPAARRRAHQLGVDLSAVVGTGADGVIERADVERVAGQAPPAGAEQARMRQAIGAAMARSKREIPHYYLATTVDMGAATTWLEAQNQRRPVTERLLPAALLLKASALALRKTPELNGFWRDGRVVPSGDVHLGVAIALRQGGLVAPALHHADRSTLDALMQGLRDLVNRARAGRLRSSELSDSTVTVTSMGEQGAEAVFGVIFPPQLAIVGFGRVVERPWAVAGRIEVRPVVKATLAADHRASDGHRGARFLAALDELLQRPEAL
jgi:pyruvate dehydrogenase E2 component (dihydrolipoamide acetyltransferase)